MKAASEAVVHAAVVGPVLILAGLIHGAALLCQVASDLADRFVG